MTIRPSRATVITCDVRGCGKTIQFETATGPDARRMAARDHGWVSRASNLVHADFCPTHAGRVEQPSSVDTLRVFRDPYGALAYVWPGSTRPVSCYRAASLDAVPGAAGWVELLPAEVSYAGPCPNCDGRRIAAMVTTIAGTFWRCAHCNHERPVT